MNAKNSSNLPVDHGVPQGSILGPILFLIYLNDLPANLTSCHAILFADDTTVFNSDFNTDSLREKQRINLSEAEQWLNNNFLKLNKEKTKTIYFRPRPETSETVKLLGVYIDSGLRWRDHIDYLAGKLNTHIYQIRKTVELVESTVARTLYFATFQSTVAYSVALWGSSSCSQRIFILQKKAVRILGGAKSGAHCKPLFKDLSILTIPCLYIYTVLLIIKSNIESILRRSDIHGYRTRGNQNLELPFHRLEISQHSVFYQGIRLFNSLHISVQNLPLSRFKSHIKSLLLQRACYSIQEFLECCED